MKKKAVAKALSEARKAHFWLVKNARELGKFAGKWVCLSTGGIIGSGDSIREAKKNAGTEPALLIKVPAGHSIGIIR